MRGRGERQRERDVEKRLSLREYMY